MNKYIFLIGFMGSGKTTVGRQLAKRLQAVFLDTDEMIEEQEGRSISEIFAQDGETYFRDLETGVLRKLLEKKEQKDLTPDKTGRALIKEAYLPDESRCPAGRDDREAYTVVSVGGGLPVRPENRALLHRLGTTFFLTAQEDTLVQRLSGSKNRPLLQGVDIRERIRSLSAARLAQYMDAADHLVAVDHKTPGRIAEEIISLAG